MTQFSADEFYKNIAKENKKTHAVIIRLTDDMYDKIKSEADTWECSKSQVIRSLISVALKYIKE